MIQDIEYIMISRILTSLALLWDFDQDLMKHKPVKSLGGLSREVANESVAIIKYVRFDF